MRQLSLAIRRWSTSDIFNGLLRGTFIVLIIQVIGTGSRYVSEVLFARWLGVESYGVYSFVFSWATVLAVLARMGFDTGVLRFIPEYIERQQWGRLIGLVRRVRLLVIAAGIVIALITTALALLIPNLSTDSTALALGAWLIPLIALMHVHMEMTRGTQKLTAAYVPFAILRPWVVIAIAFALFTLSGDQLTASQAVLSLLVGLSLLFVIQSTVLRSVIPSAAREAEPEFLNREWLRVSLPLLMAAASFVLLSRSDVLLLGLLKDETQSGIYLASTTVATLVSFVLLAVSGVAAPMISSYHARQDSEGLQQIMTLSTVGTGSIAVIIGAVVLLGGRLILSWYGPEFLAGYPALVLLVLGQVVNASAGPVGYLIQLTGNEQWSARVFAVSAAVNIVLGLILIPFFGLIGAALGTVAAMIMWNIWLSVLVKNRLGLLTFVFLLALPFQQGQPQSE